MVTRNSASQDKRSRSPSASPPPKRSAKRARNTAIYSDDIDEEEFNETLGDKTPAKQEAPVQQPPPVQQPAPVQQPPPMQQQGNQGCASVGDIILGVNGISCGGKTYTEVLNLLQHAGLFCHLAVARFQGCMNVLVRVPQNVKGGDLIRASCMDGSNVEVNVPAGLKGGEKFQLQIKQPQYNSEAGLTSFINSKLRTLPQREAAFKEQQGRTQLQQIRVLEQQKIYQIQQQQKQEQLRIQQIAEAQKVQLIQEEVMKESAVAVVVERRKPLPKEEGGKAAFEVDGMGRVNGQFKLEEFRALTLGILKFGGFEWEKILESEEFGGALARRDVESCKAKFEDVIRRREGVAKKEEEEKEAEDKKEIDEEIVKLKEAAVKKKKRNGSDEDLEEKAWEEVLKRRCEDEEIAEYPPSMRVMVISTIFKILRDRRKKAQRRVPVSEQIHARHVLNELCAMWGTVYEEEAHDIYSWRVFGLAGVVEGRGVVGEYVKNPIEPGTLSLKHGASWAKAIDEETPSVPDKPTMEEVEEDACTLHWIYNKCALGKEFEMLVEEGVFAEDRFPYELRLSDDWVGNVDFDLLGEMHDEWGGTGREDRKFKVEDDVKKALKEVWTRKGSGWAWEGGEVYGGKDNENEKEEYLNKFEEWYNLNNKEDG
ncbi:hypothetical protein TL16_g02804, partial [Triparma laevis f. inornata]